MQLSANIERFSFSRMRDLKILLEFFRTIFFLLILYLGWLLFLKPNTNVTFTQIVIMTRRQKLFKANSALPLFYKVANNIFFRQLFPRQMSSNNLNTCLI